MTENNEKEAMELKVSGETEPKKLGGAIVKYLREQEKVCVTAMGSLSVNQAVKGIIVARSYLASNARDISIKPGFRNREDKEEDKEVTLIAFNLELD